MESDLLTTLDDLAAKIDLRKLETTPELITFASLLLAGYPEVAATIRRQEMQIEKARA